MSVLRQANWRRLALVVATLRLGCVALGVAYGDSRFQARESHSVTVVAEGSRKGWEERKWSAQFGAFSASVQQRIDPKTGYPPRRRTWGDSFFGIRGHKERAYFSANWSPWSFLQPMVRLRGEAKELPTPTLCGRCESVYIRERTDERIVAEALFTDVEGGHLRMRFIGLAECRDRFGVAVAYAPPAGREVESLTHRLTCQPHDYSDRGYWQRQRNVTTATESIALPDKAERTLSAAGGPWLFHNRFAHLTSGTFLDVPMGNVGTVRARGEGHTVAVELTTARPADWTTFVCGDWVGEHWCLRGDRLFTEDRATKEALAARFFAEPALPPGLAALGAEFAALRGDESPPVSEALIRYENALTKLRSGDPAAPALVELAASADALKRAVREHRAEWVTGKKWRGAE